MTNEFSIISIHISFPQDPDREIEHSFHSVDMSHVYMYYHHPILYQIWVALNLFFLPIPTFTPPLPAEFSHILHQFPLLCANKQNKVVGITLYR